ncbi:MAG: hypothetical protein ACLFVD_01275 [Dehalococcoidia bacterium]
MHFSANHGQAAGVVVTPSQATTGKTITVTGTGTRDGSTTTRAVSFQVAEGEHDRQEYAQEPLDRFVLWLAANRPDLGVSENTEWQGTIAVPYG